MSKPATKNNQKFIVRSSCEYSIIVEAENEDEAIKEAKSIPHQNWDSVWLKIEAEPFISTIKTHQGE